jgi:hypothetical protein
MTFQDLQGIAKEAGYGAVPDGDYDVQVTKAEAKTSGNGKDMIFVIFKIIPNELNETKGTIPNNFVISPENPNAVAFFFSHMKALGLNDAFFAELPANTKAACVEIAEALIGRKATVTVGTRQWQGQDRNEVKKVKPFAGTRDLMEDDTPPAPSLPNGNGKAKAAAKAETASDDDDPFS